MGRFKVRYTEQARADVHAAVRYVAVDLRETDTAKRMAIRFKEAVGSLKDMPERFPLVHDSYLASLGFRTAQVGNYLIFYTVNHKECQVEVSRVLYGKRDWTAIIKESAF